MSESPSPMSRRSSRTVLVLLALLTLATFAARSWRLGAGLPHIAEPDAVLVWQAGGKELERRGESPRHLWYVVDFYPYLLARTLVALPGRSAPEAAPADAPLERHLAAAAEPYLRGRWMILALSVLLVPGTFFLCRRFLEPPWALFAAALVASSYLHTNMSQMARPHGALASFCLLSVLASLRLLERPSAARTAVAALAAGLAAATLHSGFFVLPTALLAAWLAPAARLRVRAARAGAVLLVAGAAVVWSYPFLFEGFGLAEREGQGVLNVGAQALPVSEYGLAGYGKIVPNLFEVDPVLVVLSGLGLLAAIPFFAVRRARLRPFWVGGLHPLVTLLLFGLHPFVYARFLLPVFPWLALLGALGTRALLAGRVRPALAASLAVLVLLPSTAVVISHITYRGSTDSQTRLVGWLEARRSAGTFPIIVPYGMSIPAFLEPQRWGPETSFFWSPWISYLVDVLPPDEREGALDVRPWVPSEATPGFDALISMLEHVPRGLFIHWRPVMDVEFMERAFPRAERVALLGEPLLVLAPEREPDTFFARVLSRLLPAELRRFALRRYRGPGIEVYAVPASS